MIEVNWLAFQSKFNKRESSAFEQLSYNLFCEEFNVPIGLFRFRNQTGIETNPININDEIVGFQAKFFTNKLSENKQVIIDSLIKVKGKYSNVTKLLYYLNTEFTESSSKNQIEPQYKKEIEDKAIELGILVEWRVQSHIERQLALPKNNYLAEYFFSLGKGFSDFLNEIANHTKNLLFTIHNTVDFNSVNIKLDRSKELAELKATISSNSITIIAGEGGCGKTALIKSLYNNYAETNPFYVFKAAEFISQNANQLFNTFGNYGLQDFIDVHNHTDQKVFVIDSAERLSDLNNQDVFIELLSALISNDWKVIFTTRLSYLEDLKFQFIEIFKRRFQVIILRTISSEQLTDLSKQYHFRLPTDSRLKKLICNPFYLNEYLTRYNSSSSSLDLSEFRASLWQKKILHSSDRKANLHVLREQCFLDIAKRRCETGLFYVKIENCSDDALAGLQSDEIIQFDSKHLGYFITHDIYEEWALELIIENYYNSSASNKDFLLHIGTSLPIRRAFRHWLSEKLLNNPDNIRRFVEEAFSSNDIESFWKDELLISILLSDYSEDFVRQFKSELLANNHLILRRIIFLLKIACKVIDADIKPSKDENEDLTLLLAYTRPKGRGWNVIIEMIHDNVNSITYEESDLVLSLLYDWISNNNDGVTTALAAKIALQLYQKKNTESEFRYLDDKVLIRCILGAASTIKEQLSQFIDEIISDKSYELANEHFHFYEATLNSTYFNVPIIIAIPEKILALADFIWWRPNEEDDEYFSHGIEQFYGISTSMHSEYFPASAYQTPIYWLLGFSFESTLDFIISFTNRAVAKYSHSKYGEDVDEVTLNIDDDTSVKQLGSLTIWSMYRGTGSPVTPYLLQSMHMALEKRLLDFAGRHDSDIVASWLIYILVNSKSVSLTAVVTSVVLAYPNKYFDIAAILFKAPRFFFYDNIRLSNESGAYRLYSIGRGFDARTKVYDEERIKTCDQEHRKLCIEHLVVQYQFFLDSDVPQEIVEERKNKIWNIIDEYYARIRDSSESEATINLRMLLTRIDGRKMKPILNKVDENTYIFNPNAEIDEDLKKVSEEALKRNSEQTSYIELKLWGERKFDNGSTIDDFYDKQPEKIILEVREIIEKLNSTKDISFYYRVSSIPAYCCSALLRFFADKLTDEDKKYCRDIVISTVYRLFEQRYDYQISDGVEAAVHAIPSMYQLFPDEDILLNAFLLLVLFDRTPLGEYKKICDYAIETIVQEMHSQFPDNAKLIFAAFIKYKPLFDNQVKKATTKRGHLSHDERIVELTKFINKYEAEWAEFFSKGHEQNFIVNNLGIRNIETALKMIPNGSNDKDYNDFILSSLPSIHLLIRGEKDSERYRLRVSVFKKFAFLVLTNKNIPTVKFIKPFLEDFIISDSTAHFLESFIYAEDQLAEYGRFWEVWAHFENPVLELIKNNPDNYRLKDIVRTYLLASNYWTLNDGDWHALKGKELQFIDKFVNSEVTHSEVLCSIAKLLCEIGQKYLNDGIYWIGKLLQRHSIKESSIDDNTVFYLERIIRKYAYLNRALLRQSLSSKNNFVSILNYLIDKGSVTAYMLREDIM